MPINLNQILTGSHFDSPYRHVHVKNFIDIETVKILTENLATDDFKYAERQTGSDKTYQVFNNILFTLENQQTNDGLHPAWVELIEW